MSPTSTSIPVTRSSRPYDTSLAQIFRQKIKADPSLFPILKDENFHDVWHRSLVNQARAQDVSEVLVPTYVPISVEDINRFSEK
jgi:hypothetical protein